MKYLKIVLTVMAVSLAISSCTKTPAFEGQATVGFESEFISNNYGSDIIYIPVVFQGTSNVFPIALDIASDLSDWHAISRGILSVSPAFIRSRKPFATPAIMQPHICR